MTHEEEVMGGTSASNAQADELCQGRHQAQRGLTSPTTDDNLFGQQIHDALAKDAPEGLRSDQLSVYESCVEMRERLIIDSFGPDAENVKRIKEERLWFRSQEGHIHSAKPDLVVTHGTKALIIEYKTLPGEVQDSPSNLQLRDQCALAAGSYGVTEIDVSIVQPLVTHDAGICRYDLISIEQAQSEMVNRVFKSNAPGAPRTAGEVQCKYCLARFTCPEYSKLVDVSVPASMSTLAIPVSLWTPEQRALFCERRGLAERWLSECKEKIKDLIREDPNAVPGWKIGEGDMTKTVNNPNELHARFVASGGTTAQFMATVTIAKGELEAQVRAATKLKGKALKAKMDELLAGITDDKRKDGSLEVVK
jgi:hypothetical protein